MPDTPLVSTMIAVFEAEKTLAATLKSVAQQSWRPVELVIVDDGSTDASSQIIHDFAATWQSDDFTIRIHRQSNQGLLAARRKGLELSTGTHLQVLDADDLIHSDKFRRCLEVLEQTGADVAVPHTQRFQAEADIADLMQPPPAEKTWSPTTCRDTTTTSNLWRTAGPLFCRRIVDQAGGFKSDVNPVIEELEFHARIKLLRPRVTYIDQVLSFYRVGQSGAITGELERLYRGRISGVRVVREMLDSVGCRESREWTSLIAMALRNVYQTSLAFRGNDELQQAACLELSGVLRARGFPWVICAPFAGPRLLPAVCRGLARLPHNPASMLRHIGS